MKKEEQKHISFVFIIFLFFFFFFPFNVLRVSLNKRHHEALCAFLVKLLPSVNVTVSYHVEIWK